MKSEPGGETKGIESKPSILRTQGAIDERHPPVAEQQERHAADPHSDPTDAGAESRRSPAAYQPAGTDHEQCHLRRIRRDTRSEEHTSELQSLMRISYAVYCLKQKININRTNTQTIQYRE